MLPKQPPLALMECRRRLAIAVRDFETEAPPLFNRLQEANKDNVFVEPERVEPILVEALRSAPEEKIRLKVARLLAALHPPVEVWLQAVEDNSPEVRGIARAGIFASTLRGVSAAVPFLRKAMQDEDPELRRAAIHAWQEVGLDLASEAVPALIEALSDPENPVRVEALETLAWLGGEARKSIPVIVDRLLEEQEESVQDAAVSALAAIDPECQFTLPCFDEIKAETRRAELLRTLRRIGVEARPLRRALETRWDPQQGSGIVQQTACTDGPRLPNGFWWKGKRYTIEPRPCELLSCVWDEESVPRATVAQTVWNDPNCTDHQIKSALNKANNVLTVAGVEWTYGLKKGYIVKL